MAKSEFFRTLGPKNLGRVVQNLVFSLPNEDQVVNRSVLINALYRTVEGQAKHALFTDEDLKEVTRLKNQYIGREDELLAGAGIEVEDPAPMKAQTVPPAVPPVAAVPQAAHPKVGEFFDLAIKGMVREELQRQLPIILHEIRSAFAGLEGKLADQIAAREEVLFQRIETLWNGPTVVKEAPPPKVQVPVVEQVHQPRKKFVVCWFISFPYSFQTQMQEIREKHHVDLLLIPVDTPPVSMAPKLRNADAVFFMTKQMPHTVLHRCQREIPEGVPVIKVGKAGVAALLEAVRIHLAARYQQKEEGQQITGK